VNLCLLPEKPAPEASGAAATTAVAPRKSRLSIVATVSRPASARKSAAELSYRRLRGGDELALRAALRATPLESNTL
jgi:hypothetical protein